jgi:hypothetical protein
VKGQLWNKQQMMKDPSQTNCLTSLFDNIGHVAQNINVVVNGLGERLGGVNLRGFFYREVDDLLGLDGVSHSTICSDRKEKIKIKKAEYFYISA